MKARQTKAEKAAWSAYYLEQAMFEREHHNEYLGLAAWGSWHDLVPDGMVGVFAGRGGRLPNGQYPNDSAWFLVPEVEYQARPPMPFSFIINEATHQRTCEIR